jgi:hypothetical protein
MSETIQKAKRAFGVTQDGREAAYILPDGELLDFSGKREGFKPNMRKYDHRVIKRIMKSRKVSREEAREIFEKAGPLRFGLHSEYADIVVEINTYQHPTEEQWDKLKELIGFASKVRPDFCFFYDIYKDGITVRAESIDRARPVHVAMLRKDLKRAQNGDFDKVREFNIWRWARGL